jgi:hemerythrin
MPLIYEKDLARIRRDHEYMIELVRRIKATCTQGEAVEDCHDCLPELRRVCHGNIDELIRSFIETTQKHNLYEALLMRYGVPQAHRIAHNQAHLELTEQMKAIRVVFSAAGDCVVAIEGIDQVLKTLLAHNDEFDRQLEAYLLAPA